LQPALLNRAENKQAVVTQRRRYTLVLIDNGRMCFVSPSPKRGRSPRLGVISAIYRFRLVVRLQTPASMTPQLRTQQGRHQDSQQSRSKNDQPGILLA
jgi:hypothetical protein